MITFALAIASFTVPFGNGPAQVGLVRELESSPEAPGSIAIDGDGNTFILDAVHMRVAVFGKDGELASSIALPSDTIEDIALMPSGDIAALDRLVERTLYVIAPNGAIVERAAVEGAGVDDGGLVTAVFADASGVWLEVYRGTQVRVIDESGRVDQARVTRPGLPFRGKFVRLRKAQDAAQVLLFDASGKLLDDRAVMFSSLLEVAGIAVTDDEIVVAGHELVEGRTHLSKPLRDVVVAVTLDAKLKEIGRRELRASPEWVPLKQLAAVNGRVAHLFVDSTGAGMEVTSW